MNEQRFTTFLMAEEDLKSNLEFVLNTELHIFLLLLLQTYRRVWLLLKLLLISTTALLMRGLEWTIFYARRTEDQGDEQSEVLTSFEYSVW